MRSLALVISSLVVGVACARGAHLEGRPPTVAAKSPAQPFPVIGEMVRYKGDSLMPQAGQDPIAWISTLTPAFAKTLPKPGSYK